MAGCGRKKCEGTNFNCMTGELLCNENGVSGPSCSDGSPILHIEHNASSCKPNHEFNHESEPCNLSPCPEGKQSNSKFLMTNGFVTLKIYHASSSVPKRASPIPFHFIFPVCANEKPRGTLKTEDIPHGGQATITCDGGCLYFKKVLSIA